MASRLPKIHKDGEVGDLSAVDPALFKPAAKVVPELIALQKKRGRPKAETTKQSTTLRLDSEVVDFFKQRGRGWQTRLNKVLKEYVVSHK